VRRKKSGRYWRKTCPDPEWLPAPELSREPFAGPERVIRMASRQPHSARSEASAVAAAAKPQ
jgi:hypothetical protein